MLQRQILVLLVVVASCGPVGERSSPPADAPTEATTVFILDEVERRKRVVEAEAGDGASAYLLSLDARGDEGRAWLERAVQLDWPEAKRDKALQMLREEPCRLGEARALLAEYRVARTASEAETVHLERLETSAEAAQGAC